MTIFLVSDWIFRHISRDLQFILLAVTAIVGLYWILTDSGRKKHYYCHKAISDIEDWLKIWQKAGVPDDDTHLAEMVSKINALKTHVAGSNEHVKCNLPNSFYAETRRLITEINKKTFYETPL
ncbi:MAG: hypothetical protein WC788_06885 [Candidatus Paceibacterota bacterium]|jgi:hypothetical protein